MERVVARVVVAQDGLPRIFRLSMEAAVSGKVSPLEEVPVPFAKIPRRAEKPRALLNLNDIQFLLHEGRPVLLALARDQERLLLVDTEREEVARIVDLDLVDPSGRQIESVSPEGPAVDPAGGRLWIINAPDGASYRLRSEAEPTGQFADCWPLLFEMKLERAVGARP